VLADRVGAQMGASTIYGTPVERDGVTVTPVAAARFGIDAGSGADPSKRQEGEGGGGGGGGHAGRLHRAQGRPLPVRAIVHPGRMLALACGAIVAGLAIMRASGRRAARKRVALALTCGPAPTAGSSSSSFQLLRIENVYVLWVDHAGPEPAPSAPRRPARADRPAVRRAVGHR
jgi:hypothetical protein